MDTSKYVKITSLLVVTLIMIILIFNTNPYVQSFLTGIVLAILVYGSIYLYNHSGYFCKNNQNSYTGAEENTDKCISDAYVKYTKLVDDCDQKTCKGSDNFKECVDFGKSMRQANGYISTGYTKTVNEYHKPAANEYHKPDSEYTRPAVNEYQNASFPVGDEHGYAYMPSVESMSRNTSGNSSNKSYGKVNLREINAKKNGYANIKFPNNTGKSMYDSTDSPLSVDKLTDYKTNKPLPAVPRS